MKINLSNTEYNKFISFAISIYKIFSKFRCRPPTGFTGDIFWREELTKYFVNDKYIDEDSEWIYHKISVDDISIVFKKRKMT